MKKLIRVIMILVFFGFPSYAFAAVDNPNIAALDDKTFVMVSGTSVYLVGVDGERMTLKDCVSIYTTQKGINYPDRSKSAVIRRQEIKKE